MINQIKQYLKNESSDVSMQYVIIVAGYLIFAIIAVAFAINIQDTIANNLGVEIPDWAKE